MSADAQSAPSDEFSSAGKHIIRSNTRFQSTLLQHRTTTLDTTAVLSRDVSLSEDMPASFPSNTAVVAFNSPKIHNPIEQQPSSVTSTLHKLQGQVQGTLADQITPLRLAGHLSVLGVAAIILLLSQVTIPDWDLPLGALPNNALAGQVAAINCQVKKVFRVY